MLLVSVSPGSQRTENRELRLPFLFIWLFNVGNSTAYLKKGKIMKVCKRDGCTNEAVGKSEYCSRSCRRKMQVTSEVTSEVTTLPTDQSEIVASEEHYLANPDMYAKRNNPYGMNWGKPMGVKTLHRHGFRLNRVTIPGDWDYSGVCKLEGDTWIVPKTALKHAKVPY